MKRQYRINFLNAEALVLSDAEFNIFLLALKESQNLGVPFSSFNGDNGRFLLIRLDTMTYAQSEDIEGESNVVTPPSPTQLREERKREEANRPVTLDDQLANPEVAK